MLTEAEKKWLEERQDKGEYNFYYCQYCNKIPSIMTGGLCAGPCPMYPGGFEYQDASEFEARVAAIMPYIVFKVVAAQAGQKDITIDSWECLKSARLVVEEEMG